MCVKYGGLVSEVQAYTDTIIYIRTMGARRGCASMHNTPNYVYEQWGLVRDVRSYPIQQIMYTNIRGLSGMCEHTHATKLCIRTIGSRPGCASINNTPTNV